jgi:hypothetical protein
MADAEIRQTTVTPDADGSIVRLQISDAPLQSESATMLLDMTVKLPEYTAPLLIAQFQRQALRVAMEVLRSFERRIIQEIRKQPHIDVEPQPIRRA